MLLKESRWFVILLLSVVLSLALAACGGQEESSAPPADESTQQEAAEVENTPTPTKAPPTDTPVPPTPTDVPPTETPEPPPTPTEPPPAESMPEEDSSDDALAQTDSDMPLPLPDDARDATYEFGEILFVSPSGVEDLVEFYRDTLTADGWEEDTDFSDVTEDFAFVEFTQGDEFIYLTIFEFDGAIDVSIDLNSAPSLAGDLGDDDMVSMPSDSSGGFGYTIADWPVPPDATDVNVSGDLLTFKVAMPLAEVAEFYRPTYEMMGFSTDCLDDAAEYTSLSCSVGTGDVTLNFFAFEGFEDETTEVEIDFVNYAVGSSFDSSDGTPGEFGVTEKDGLPLPNDYTYYASEGSEFGQNINIGSPSDLATLVEFFQTEMANYGWTLDDSEQADAEATLRFSGPDGTLVVAMQAGDETEIALTTRNPAAAEEAGILPPAGQSRIYLINFSEEELTVTIDGEVTTVEAGAGMESPDDAPYFDLPPGTYEVTTEASSGSVTDEVVVGPDETWGLLLDEAGALPVQVY